MILDSPIMVFFSIKYADVTTVAASPMMVTSPSMPAWPAVSPH